MIGRNREKVKGVSGEGKRLGGSGFTLVEILVVVSIVSVLMAILIGYMSWARENARSVICRSNLREWGSMMLLYTDDYNGSLPYEDRGDEPLGRFCWFDSMNWAGRSTPAPEGVKVCPTVLRSNPFSEESYRMNSKLSETTEGSKYYRLYRKLSTLTRPSQTVLLFDGDVGGDKISFKGRWRKKNDDVNYRHNNGTNFLFADWHVENFLEQAVYDNSINNTPIVWQPEDMGPWKPNP